MAGCRHGPIYSPRYKHFWSFYTCRPCYEAGRRKDRTMNGWRYMLHLRLRHGNVEFPSCLGCARGGASHKGVT